MAGLLPIITAISNDVVANITAAGLPPLSGGGILVGKVYLDENRAPPYIVFVPRASKWAAPSTPRWSTPINPRNTQAVGTGIAHYIVTNYGQGYTSPVVTVSAPDVVGGTQATATAVAGGLAGAVVDIIPAVVGSGYMNPPTVTITDGGPGIGATAAASLQPPANGNAVNQRRAIYSEVTVFEVHAWGVNSVAGVITPDANLDFDATRQLVQQVVASCYLLGSTILRPLAGVWTESKSTTTQIDLLGHEFVFGIEVDTPVSDYPMSVLPPTALVPPGTQGNPTVLLAPFAGGAGVPATTG